MSNNILALLELIEIKALKTDALLSFIKNTGTNVSILPGINTNFIQSSSDITITANNINLKGYLNLQGNSNIGTLAGNIPNDININTLNVSNNTILGITSINSSLNISGSAILNNLLVNNDTTFLSDLLIQGNLNVSSMCNFSNNISIISNLYVSGNSLFNNNISLLSNLYVSNNTIIGNNLTAYSICVSNDIYYYNNNIASISSVKNVLNTLTTSIENKINSDQVYNKSDIDHKLLDINNLSGTQNISILSNLYVSGNSIFENVYVSNNSVFNNITSNSICSLNDIYYGNNLC